MYFFSASRWPSASALPTFAPPRTASTAASRLFRARPCSRASVPASALVVRQRQQEHLAGDVGIAALLRFLVRLVQQADQVTADLHLAFGAGDLGQALERRVDRFRQRRHVDTGARQERAAGAVGVAQHRGQHVQRLDVLVLVADRDRLRVGQRFLEFRG